MSENGNANNSNNGKATKAEEPQPHPHPHPVFEQLPGVQYCINSPPPCPLHYKCVYIIGRYNSGIPTLSSSSWFNCLNSKYARFLKWVAAIYNAVNFNSLYFIFQRFVETMREIQGVLIVTSCFQMIIGFIGLWRNIVRHFRPLSMAPLISFTGLGLYHLGFPLIGKCVEVGIPELLIMAIISQAICSKIYKIKEAAAQLVALLGVGRVQRPAATRSDLGPMGGLPRLGGLGRLEILTWSGAFNKSKQGSCRTDGSGLISAAPWLYIPFPFQWGPPTFRFGQILASIVASFVASMEALHSTLMLQIKLSLKTFILHILIKLTVLNLFFAYIVDYWQSTGSFIAAARYGSATPVPPSVISRGVGWLGIGTLLNALFGSITGSTAVVENVGLLALTKAGSRRVIQIASVFMILFSLLASAGLGFLQFCNLNNFRTKLVLGLSFYIGLSLPQYFREYQLNSTTGPVHTHAGWFNDIMSVIFMSHATVAAIVALGLDCTLHHGTEGAHNEEARKDNGSYWWDKFMIYNKDVRNEEFYKLPGQLNSCFPAF
ncbi:hypothetical protein BUALT_Bualt12G0093900 [Buddleja alternifolia]|uniref:Nucleobase-ascorbate transporter 12 n=1 Tax=Buddleja alternifolia TaxID=168488 RepID=A0AAV6WRI2_9LAMI|nr:hypothetical protein BUALT_Bualt12G0093900 [Buddleja alternifolia]